MAHPHGHQGGHRRPAPLHDAPWRTWRHTDRITKTVWLAVAGAALLTVIGLVALWPGGGGLGQDPALVAGTPLAAHVTSTSDGPCSGTTEADRVTCRFAVIHIAGRVAPEAPRGGGEVAPPPDPVIEQGTDGGGRNLQTGDDILVTETKLDDGTSVFSFYDYQRSGSLWVLGLLFVAAVLVLGRWRGLGAIAGLAASLVVLVVFMLPSLLDGHSPVVVAVVAASAIAFIALYLAHGVSVATSVALLGTFASLAVTALLSWVFVGAAKLTGLTDESAFFLSALGGGIDLRGVLLAGFVIGALGVLDDVTVTQVSAVAELRAAHTGDAPREIYRAALRIGRDHISSTVNTLFLAYAGAALPLLLLFTEAGQSVTSIAGREVVATEIVRSLVGSIGLVSAVPITTWLAVRALPREA